LHRHRRADGQSWRVWHSGLRRHDRRTRGWRLLRGDGAAPQPARAIARDARTPLSVWAAARSDGIARAPAFHTVEHFAHGDPRHAVAAILHRDRIVLTGLAIRVDDEIVKPAIRPRALGIRVAHQAHHGNAECHGDVEWARIGREHERRAVEYAHQV